MMPRVSVCIPTYNYGPYVGEAIESVLGQTFADFELLVSDNASTDNTEQIVGRYLPKDNRVRYFRNQTNCGMVANWNRCLDLASGDHVLILCADDLLEPRCLERLSGLLGRHPRAALASCGRGILVDGELRGFLCWSDREVVLEGTKATRLMLLHGNIIGEPSAVMFRRNLAGRGFDPAYKQLTDMDMWLRLLQEGGCIITPEVLCRYRQHPAQETKRHMKSYRIFTEGRRLYSSFGRHSDVGLNRAERALARSRPLLAFLYTWLFARFFKSNLRLNVRPLDGQRTTEVTGGDE